MYGAELPNFTEISKLNIGAAVIVTGTLVLTPDAKQPFEVQAAEIAVEGPSTPDYPDPAEAPFDGISAHRQRICARGRTPSRPYSACAASSPTRSTSSSRSATSSTSTPRSSPAPTARARARCSRSRRWILTTRRCTDDGKIDYSKDFFGKETNLTVSGQLNGETYRPGLQQHLYVRPDLPRRELQHHAPRGRVLDDRTGDRVRRPVRRYEARRGHDQVRHRLRARALPRGDGVLQPVRRQGPASSGCTTS